MEREIYKRSLLKGLSLSCGCLSKENKEKMIGERYGNLTIVADSGRRENTNIVWRCRCDCGNFCEKTTLDLHTGYTSCGCLSFQKANKTRYENTFDKIEDLTGQKFGKLTVIRRATYEEELQIKQKGTTFQKNMRYWLCECDCENKTQILLGRTQLISGWKTSCGCERIRSKGEKQIEKILKENDIVYEKEKSFETCKNPTTGKKLFFDFYIKNKILLEYDGEQHYDLKSFVKFTRGTKEDFIKSQNRDKIKENWALNNGYVFIRIPYFPKAEKISLEDLLENSTFKIIREDDKNE